VSHGCPAGCCPHTTISSLSPSAAAVAVAPGGYRADVAGGADGCPADLPAAPLPERICHLYACRELSTYHIAEIVGISRQRVTRLLHRTGVAVKPKGAGRPRPSRRPEARTADAVLASLYLDRRLTSAQISDLTGISARTVRDRLRACGVPMRTRGAFNREDRATISQCLLAHLYVQERLTAAQVGAVLGVSRKAVLRAAHEEGLPVRIGGPPPRRGPSDIELIHALYADVGVRRAMARHGLPQVPPGGPVWQRFPVPARLTRDLAVELYVTCGLGLTHIELLTGQPAESIRKLLRAAGVTLRAAGGRSPFLRRWRASLTNATG
jgi:hypothetical protein